MGVIDAPQWLLPAYVRSMKAVGATAPAEMLQAAGARLVAMWQSPDRRFHNLKHAIDMLARVDELADESHSPDVMRLAVWYHGCVFSSATEETYKRNGGEDEVASAAYAAEDLQALGMPDAVTDRICALILNLKRHNLKSDDIDAMALNDADLGTLAVEPQQYKRYRELVREEYAHIPDVHYLQARLTIVTKLLARDALFSSPLGARWELAARQNLEAEKRRLEDALAKLVPAGEAGAAGVAGPGAIADGVTAGAQAAGVPGAPVAGSVAVPVSGPGPAASSSPVSPVSAVSADAVSAVTATGGIPAVTLKRASMPSTAPSVAPVGGNAASTGVSAASPLTGEFPAVAMPDVPVESFVPVAPTPAAPGVAPVAASAAVAEPGVSVPAVPAGATAPVPAEEFEHTNTMESCAEDIDRLMSQRRCEAPAGTPAAGVPAAAPADRQSLAEAERVKLAEKLRAKAEEAKILREARTGEFQPITAEIIDDGASEL